MYAVCRCRDVHGRIVSRCTRYVGVATYVVGVRRDVRCMSVSRRIWYYSVTTYGVCHNVHGRSVSLCTMYVGAAAYVVGACLDAHSMSGAGAYMVGVSRCTQ